MKTGVFVGLITLDCIYRTQRPLAPNEKQVAEEVLLAAGGPATNAATAFQALGNRAILVGALGNHPLSAVVRDDLQKHGVELLDLTPDVTVPPPFSSIVVNTATGDRAVISRNAVDRPQPSTLPDRDVLATADCVLLDGHQMQLGHHVGQAARRQNIPVVVDAGSWKVGFETVLPLAQVVIASATFCPPEQSPGADAIAYLQSSGIPYTAVTQGARPVMYRTPTATGTLPVPQIAVMDTLGAGDIFHGAFCHGYVRTGDFLTALQTAAQIAAASCQSFGTRQWIQ
ncbi:MAG: PfkB family carbohydrate kinase, partial [Cyanobacteria bacterium P01_H01_bin.58]